MSISVADNFQYKGGKPLDARMKFATILDMTAAPVADLYDGCFSYVVAEQKYYSYDSNNENDHHLGKWREYSSGGAEYSDFTGATSQAAGAHGLVPAPTTGDISKFLKGDGTWATVPMPSFDYSNTSPEAMNFSTDEKVIGTWIDGKPLYQKVLTLQNVAYDWNTTNSYGISNIDHVVSSSVRIHYKNGSSEWWFTPYSKGSGECVTFTFDEHDFRALWSNTGEIQNIYETEIILRYTKTTDTAVASGEKIVGQWIDGKPVYEKTITSTIPMCSQQYVPESSYESIGVSVDKCIEINGFFESNGICTPISYAMAQGDTKVSCITARVLTNTASEHKNTIQLSNANTGWGGHSAIITLRYTKTS